MRKLLFSIDAQRDVAEIQKVSLEEHGDDGVMRYTMLIDATLRHLLEVGMPTFGTEEHAYGYFSYHLRNHKRQVTYKGVKVKNPCHLIFFRVTDDTLHIGRILHDTWSFEKHISAIEYPS